MSFKPGNYISGLILRPEWMVVQPITTADIHVGPHKRALDFSGFLQWQNNVFNMALFLNSNKWDVSVSPLPERNMCTGSTLWPFYFE